MAMDLRLHVETSELDAAQVRDQTRLVYDNVLQESPYLDGGNFRTLHPTDLKRLFDHYDARFFKAQIRTTLGDVPLHFRLSKRMTRAGGRTARVTPRNRPSGQFYEISVSTTLLFQCFDGDDHRPITVAGIPCRDRMEALQRIMEHELVHLIERLLWSTSSCSAPRFQAIASRFFGHEEHTHQLITPTERALAKFGIRPGDQVRFLMDGARYTGIVNRITKRATVLVKDRGGVLHSDGNRYATFYVPVELLETLQAG